MHTTPPKGGADLLSYSSDRIPRTHPTLTTYEEAWSPASTLRHLAREGGKLLLVFAPLAVAGALISLALISCLASYQFILIKEGRELRSVTGIIFF